MSLQQSRILRLFRISPLVNFKPGAGVVYHPTLHDAIENDNLRVKRAIEQGIKPMQPLNAYYNGLDPEKIIDNEWKSLRQNRSPMQGGYPFTAYRLPSVKAFNEDELVKFFNVEDYGNKYTMSEIWRSARPRLNFLIMIYLSFLAPFIYLWGEGLYKQRYEPLEASMPIDEYNKHFIWHMLGHKLDHHAFVQYSEARRTHKWRNPNVNPEDYIPPQYRNLQHLPPNFEH
ncbi:hypothetical protein BdWA1_002790 [Babesia duncani]|uniref:Uncharacterized protein n=1 Tax=Babesia duncani TaxID=323732 RepID=A0AAD9PJV0_9APIC|nr:hypothetical protein BdWA1_002790 [Babesia duncani]